MNVRLHSASVGGPVNECAHDSRDVDVALLLEVEEDLLCALLRGAVLGLDGEIRVFRDFVGIADTGEFGNDPGPRLGVEAFPVARLADL